MRLLLDTHVYIWWLKNDRHLRKDVRSKIFDATDVYISSASIWEAAIKIKLKKLNAKAEELVKGIAASGFSELPIMAYHAAALVALPEIHRDPFDRMLIAQAISEPLTFLTADKLLAKYSHLVEVVSP